MRHLIVKEDGIVAMPPYPGQSYRVLRTEVTMHSDGAGPVMLIVVDPQQQQPIHPNLPLYAAS